MTAGDGAPFVARVDGLDDALRELAPTLERFATARTSNPIPAFQADPVPLPATGVGLETVIAELGGFVDAGCRIGMPGWFGFVTTAPTTAPIVAATAAATAGSQRYLFHAFNHLEHLALGWLAELCGIPANASGVFTSGGSTANLIALGAARQAAFEQRGRNVADDGMEATPGRVYTSDRAHRTVHRSAAVLGLGRTSVRAAGTDVAGHVATDQLRRMIAEDRAAGAVPIAIVAVAGSTDTGSIDDLAGLAEVARQEQVWLHVDGAYGLVAQCCPELRSRFEGVELADSWIVDPHKWLAAGTGIGAVYVRDGGVLTRAFSEGEAAYLEGSFAPGAAPPVSQFDGFAGRWADQSVELSSPSRGAAVWAVLREIGRDGVVARIHRDVTFAQVLAERVRAHEELELLCEPDLSIVCFRYVPVGPHPPEGLDILNSNIAEALRHTTATVPTSTIVNGNFALRPCFINPRTTQQDIDDLISNTTTIGRRLASTT